MILLLASTLAVLGMSAAPASDYDERRAASVKICDAIDPAASQSGLYFTFAIIPAPGGPAPLLLHSSGYYLDGHANLRIFVRGDDIERRVPGFAPGRRYSVQATLTLTVPTGSGDVRWTDAFIDRVFPARERSQSMTQEIEFPIASEAGRLRR
jgi:hypothetical protein